jgi:hypothetical protein
MNHIIFYTATNRLFKKDATGAFIPEAKRYSEYIKRVFPDATVVLVPIKTRGRFNWQIRKQVESAFEKYNGEIKFGSVSFFCHGWQSGIQFGYKWKSGAERLSRVIRENNDRVRMVNFYACLVCKDANNFARWLYEATANGGNLQVFGHYTAGHTTMNPNIKIYTNTFKPFMWSKREYADYNMLISTQQSESMKEEMRKEDSYIRFAIPFVPNLLRKYRFTRNLKRK